MMITLRMVTRIAILNICLLANIQCASQNTEAILMSRVWEVSYNKSLFFNDNYYQRGIEPQLKYRLIFLNDSVEIDGGIYYVISDEKLKNQYPYVYCGNKTTYALNGSELSLYHPGYKIWKKFNIRKINNDSLVLEDHHDTFDFIGVQEVSPSNLVLFKKIEINYFDIEGYGVWYNIAILPTDELQYTERPKDEGSTTININLPKGYFDDVTSKLNNANIMDLDSLYVEMESGSRKIELILSTYEGKKKRVKLYGNVFPNNLNLALVPIMYAHHKYLYNDLPAEDMMEKTH